MKKLNKFALVAAGVVGAATVAVATTAVAQDGGLFDGANVLVGVFVVGMILLLVGDESKSG